jgi:hypothetical protein
VSTFKAEDGDSIFVRQAGINIQVHKAILPIRSTSTYAYSRLDGVRQQGARRISWNEVEVTGGWRNLHIEALYTSWVVLLIIYYSDDQVKNRTARIGDIKTQKVWIGNPQRKRPRGKPRRRWNGNSTKCLKEKRVYRLLWIMWWTFGFIKAGVNVAATPTSQAIQ